MRYSEEEEEEEDAAPAPKAQKLMGDAIKSGAAPSKPKSSPKAAAQKPPKPKRNTRSIPAEEKNKAPVPQAEEEDDESLVLRKLKPKIPDHSDAHPVAEDMHIRKDAGLRLWRQSDPYAMRRRKRMLQHLQRPRSLCEMQSSQGLLHLRPNLLARLLLRNSQSPRGTLGVYLLRRRTRPQCLKLKKKMMILMF